MPSTTTRPAWAPPPPPAGGPLAFDFGSGNAPTHPSGNGRPPSPRTIELGNLPVAVPPEKVLQPSAAGRPAASPLATLVYQALYLLGGFAMVISTQYLHYEGAAGASTLPRTREKAKGDRSPSTPLGRLRVRPIPPDQRSMLPVMANYVGMVLVALFPGGRGSTPEDIGVTTRRVPQSVFVAQRALLWISLLDLLGYVFVTLAIFYIGSGVRCACRVPGRTAWGGVGGYQYASTPLRSRGPRPAVPSDLREHRCDERAAGAHLFEPQAHGAPVGRRRRRHLCPGLQRDGRGGLGRRREQHEWCVARAAAPDALLRRDAYMAVRSCGGWVARVQATT